MTNGAVSGRRVATTRRHECAGGGSSRRHGRSHVGLRGAPDSAIAATANVESRIVVAGDADFVNALRFAPGSHPGIIVLRLPNDWTPAERADRLMAVLNAGVASSGARPAAHHVPATMWPRSAPAIHSCSSPSNFVGAMSDNAARTVTLPEDLHAFAQERVRPAGRGPGRPSTSSPRRGASTPSRPSTCSPTSSASRRPRTHPGRDREPRADHDERRGVVGRARVQRAAERREAAERHTPAPLKPQRGVPCRPSTTQC